MFQDVCVYYPTCSTRLHHISVCSCFRFRSHMTFLPYVFCVDRLTPCIASLAYWIYPTKGWYAPYITCNPWLNTSHRHDVPRHGRPPLWGTSSLAYPPQDGHSCGAFLIINNYNNFMCNMTCFCNILYVSRICMYMTYVFVCSYLNWNPRNLWRKNRERNFVERRDLKLVLVFLLGPKVLFILWGKKKSLLPNSKFVLFFFFF